MTVSFKQLERAAKKYERAVKRRAAGCDWPGCDWPACKADGECGPSIALAGVETQFAHEAARLLVHWLTENPPRVLNIEGEGGEQLGVWWPNPRHQPKPKKRNQKKAAKR